MATYTSDQLQEAKKMLLVDILAKTQTINTAKDIRSLLKEYIIHEGVYLTDKKTILNLN